MSQVCNYCYKVVARACPSSIDAAVCSNLERATHPRPSRILVCGGRGFSQRELMWEYLNDQTPLFAKDFCIIQGGAPGADTLAKDWAIHNGIPCITVNANWDVYRKAAGPMRNAWMLKFCDPELVIAFPGGVGTEDMKFKAAMAGVPVLEALK
jgi:predicted Rossmann-fold nucleotide-binding protein